MKRAGIFNTVLAIVLLAAIAGAVWVFTGDTEPEAMQGGRGDPVPVVTETVRRQPFTDTLQALGTTRANESIEVTSEVSNTIESIQFTEGETVQKGEILVTLEDSEAQANLAAARAALVDSRSQYRRSKQLSTSGAVSASQLQQLEAQMDADAAEVNAAESRLADHTIRAPFTGRVGLRQVSAGSLVQPGTVITTLDDIDPIKLDFSVPEVFIGTLQQGQVITAHTEAYPDRDFTGQVESIATRVNPVTRALTVRAEVPNPEGILKPGMFLTVQLIRESSQTLLIPEQAVIPENQRQFVFVVKDGHAQKREIRTGRRQPGVVEILSGLEAGETIVTDGAHKLVDGMPVDGTEQSA